MHALTLDIMSHEVFVQVRRIEVVYFFHRLDRGYAISERLVLLVEAEGINNVLKGVLGVFATLIFNVFNFLGGPGCACDSVLDLGTVTLFRRLSFSLDILWELYCHLTLLQLFLDALRHYESLCATISFRLHHRWVNLKYQAHVLRASYLLSKTTQSHLVVKSD